MTQKPYHTFDAYYHELAAFLKENDGFPERERNSRLYYWMVRMRIEKKAGHLDESYVKLLDGLGFVWDMQEYRWQQNYDMVKALLLQNVIPHTASHPYSYYWMNKHLYLAKQRQLPEKKMKQMEEIAFLINNAKEKAILNPAVQPRGKQIRWNIKYEQLVHFRKQNPNSWPKLNAADEEEKKLGAWCILVRSYYNKGILPGAWYEKLLALGFDFLKKENKWMAHFEQVRDYMAQNHGLPLPHHKLYKWTATQYNKFNLLSDKKKALLNEIGLRKYFDEGQVKAVLTWEESYEKLRELVQGQKSWPVLQRKSPLFQWVKEQRQSFRANKLSAKDTAMLQELGVI